jgi:hypothetical protein
MRKLLLIVLLVLGAALSVSAIGEAELSSLASYVPEDVLAYAAIRTDDDFLRSIDALVNKGLPFLPPDEVPSELHLLDLLDQQLEAMELGTFSESIRPWLGSTAALALFAPAELSDEPNGLVIVAANGDEAYEFLEPLFSANEDFEASEINNMRAFVSTDEDEPAVIAFGGDAIFFANNEDFIPAGQADAPLSENAQFNDTLSKLPADEYVSIIYLNSAEFQRLSMAQMQEELPPFAEDLLNLSPSLALGFNLTEDAFTMDMAQVIDTSIFEEYGLTVSTPSALDMGFTSHVPADAIAYMQGSDFGPSLQLAFDNLRALGEYIKSEGGIVDLFDPNSNDFETEAQRHAANQFDLAWILGVVNIGFSGATGLSLENDVLPVLDGDAALYLRVLPVDDFVSPILPDGAILFQSSNPEGAQAIVNQLTASAEAYEAPVTTEDYGNGIALVFPAEESMGMAYPALDVMIGASDDVIALGTRSAVEASLNTSGSLADDASFQAASQSILSGSQSLIYFSPTPFFTVIDPLIEEGEIPMDEDTENAYRIASLVESATISAAIQSDGTSTLRFVISFSDEPRPVPQAPDAQ